MRAFIPAAVLVCLAAPAAAVTAVTVNPTGQLQGSGAQVIVTGTVTCTIGENVNINAQVIQGVGRNAVASGQGSTGLRCVDGNEDWIAFVTVHTFTPFRNGKAVANIDAAGCDADTCTTFARASREITLRKR